VVGIIPGVENMPLQIRRGTNAERLAMTQPLAQGELLYVTNDQRLYIGNGSTLGGVQITGYTNEDAQDAAAQLFSNGAHTGITFTYNDTSASLSAVLDLSNFAGTIRADAFKGSVFADDGSTIGGTLLVDAVDGVLRGTHIGTLTGNVTGNVTGNTTGTHFGNVTGNVLGDTTGYHTGDVTGSVFAENSSVMVDTTSNSLYGSVYGDLYSEHVYVPDSGVGLQVYAKKDSSFSANYYNGTSTAKTAIAAGDSVGAISVKGWNGSTYEFAGAVFATWEAGAVTTDIAPKSTVTIASGKGGVDNQFASLDSKGIWLAPVVKTTVYSVAGTALPSAVTMGQGARAFVSDATSTTFAAAYVGSGANKVSVYSDGSVWRIG
jgi:hypothetical protein